MPFYWADKDDPLVMIEPVLERYGCFAAFLREEPDDEAAWKRLRMSETSGRPLGDNDWLGVIEAQTGRKLKPQKRGPKGKAISVFSKLTRHFLAP